MRNEIEKNQWDETQAFAAVDALCEYLREHQPRAQVLNLERYSEMCLAKTLLEEVLAKAGYSVKLSVQYIPMLQHAALSAELDDFEVSDPLLFAAVLQLADNFEVYPLLNGRVRIAFSFNRMMKSIY